MHMFYTLFYLYMLFIYNICLFIYDLYMIYYTINGPFGPTFCSEFYSSHAFLGLWFLMKFIRLSFTPLLEVCILIASSLGYGVKNGLILPPGIMVALFLLSLFRYIYNCYNIFIAYYYVILA